MFEELTIKNFQSHKDTHIKFENGVNVLVGSSDQGKSAILRAILWAINNRPLGTDDIVSHWARDSKNKIADTMSVRIETENGVVVRKRTADKNEYSLRDNWDNEEKSKLFEAVNKEVPEDIQKFFRLSDVNIQMQHDAPFLLSASASDVAKYFNKIVRLEVIDAVLGNAESARRDTNKKIKETENEKIGIENQLKDYEWIEQAQELVEKLSKVQERVNVYEDTWQVIDCEVRDYLIQKDILKDHPDVKRANGIIEKIENIKIDYDSWSELEQDIEKYKKVFRDVKIYAMVKSGKGIIDKIESIEVKIKDSYHEQNTLLKEVSDYEEDKKLSDMGFDKIRALELIKEIEGVRPEYDTLRELSAQIKEFEFAETAKEAAEIMKDELIKRLPEICPTCGAPMGECRE